MKQFSIFLITSLFPLLVFGQQWTDIVAPGKVNDVLETSSTVWMATNGGIITIDKQTNTVSQFTKSKDGLPSNLVEGIAKDNAGNLWIGTYTAALAKYDGSTWTAVPYPASFPEMQTHSIRIDQNNVIWAGTSKGLVKYDGTNWDLFNSSNTNLNFFHDAWNIEMDQQGNIYTVSSGVIKFDGTTWTDLSAGTSLFSYGGAHTEMLDNGTLVFGDLLGHTVALYDTAWTIYNTSNGDFPTGGVKTINKDGNGDIYISITGHGVYKLQNGTWILETLPNSSIDATTISTMFTDAADNLWLANNFDFVKIGGGNTTNININISPIQSNEIAKIYHHNTDVFVLNDTIISHYDANGIWSNITVPLMNPILNGTLRNMAITDNGEYWVSSGWSELYNWDGQNWTIYTNTNSPMPIAVIRDMVWEEESKTLWLATSKGVIKLKNQQWTIYTSTNTLFSDDNTSQIEIRNGVIYVGIGASVYKLDGTTWTDLTPSNPESLRNMYVDKSENIWISNWNGGVLKYENSTWSNISTLQNYKVETIVEGNNNHFYFGTEKDGIAEFDGTNWTYFKADNSQLTHDNINHLSMGANNKLWIGTEGGINTYQTAATVSNKNLIENEANLKIFPTPLMDQATIEFTLKNSQNVRLGIYDINGRLVQSIIQNEMKPAGRMAFDCRKGALTSGIYLVKLELENSIQTIKILVR